MEFARGDVAHLLRRAGFGGSPAEIDALAALPTWEAVVDRVLDTSANPPDPIPAAVDDPADTWYRPWVASVQHWMDRMATSPTPIVEKMTLFWHGHLTSSTQAALPRLMFRQVRTYRSMALGDVHDLLQAAAVDPAMLRFLDGESNVAGAPNENFARELMELFTLGRDGYTEADVVGMARAWTGHNLDDDFRYVFRADRHDAGTKTIFGITRKWDGPEAITEIVRGSQQQTCARFLAGEVWSFFTGLDADDGLRAELGDALVAGGMQTAALLRAVFLHPRFRSPEARGGLVRSPVEWQVAAMRGVGAPASEMRPEWWMDRLGQALYRPPNVGGWGRNAAWVSTSTQWGKTSYASFVRWVAKDRGVLAETESMGPAAAAQAAFDRFGIDAPSDRSRQAIEAFVRSERAADRPWSVPPHLVALAVLTPEFQVA